MKPNWKNFLLEIARAIVAAIAGLLGAGVA